MIVIDKKYVEQYIAVPLKFKENFKNWSNKNLVSLYSSTLEVEYGAILWSWRHINDQLNDIYAVRLKKKIVLLIFILKRFKYINRWTLIRIQRFKYLRTMSFLHTGDTRSCDLTLKLLRPIVILRIFFCTCTLLQVLITTLSRPNEISP